MNSILRAIIISNLIALSGQLLGSMSKEVFPNALAFTTEIDTTLNLDESRNRFPEILRDAKLLMSEVVISDYNKDTLEVAFLLSKIFELAKEGGGKGKGEGKSLIPLIKTFPLLDSDQSGGKGSDIQVVLEMIYQ